MKNPLILLAALLLMTMTGTALAAGEFAAGSDTGTVRVAGHAAANQEPPLGADEEPAVAQPIPLMDYVVSEQVTIGLACRPLASGDQGVAGTIDSIDLKQVAQHVMLGVHYRF